ncbi:hypothetical protein [Saccharothrix variisporea]|uniref:Uncharacterized protein n=1 Tax=Saccharothrix variisporea TaxID=543527 RepID=A0A495XQD7_9PSEU|nr:hypothetical protein [Saccharothrix variisporea]RKT74663.1 hypothetical protein DFJ66_8030 [Saccharothrix variisporea]
MTTETRRPATPSPVLGAAALTVAGVMFLLYPALRPAGDDATTFATTAWMATHLFAMIGFILVPIGLYALLDLAPARTALMTTWLGAGLVLPYYGAEDFALHVIGERALRDNDPSLTDLAADFRYHPLAATTFALGLLLLAVGGILTAIATARSEKLSKWSALPLAAGMVLFFPQFYTPLPVRIAHGALMAIGCVYLALNLWQQRKH